MTQATAAVSQFEGIDSSLAMADSGGPSFPWLQATDYQPKNGNTAIKLVIPEDAYNLLGESASGKLECNPETISTTEGDTLAFEPTNVRWVILSRPRGFKIDRENNVSAIEKGVKWNGAYKSVMRLLLAAVVDDEFLLDAEGSLQIFTLKLKGLKTEFVSPIVPAPGDRSITSMNNAICKALKTKGWVGHLVSTELEVVPRSFKTSDGSQSSWGCYFQFREGSSARPLPAKLQKQSHAFVSSEDFIALANDPFGLGAEKKKDATDLLSSEIDNIEF
jgi:hypothetical protein